jgi:hypothetical protein
MTLGAAFKFAVIAVIGAALFGLGHIAGYAGMFLMGFTAGAHTTVWAYERPRRPKTKEPT